MFNIRVHLCASVVELRILEPVLKLQRVLRLVILALAKAAREEHPRSGL
jgi:hypothetical protein